jgi:uncharacterized protein YndB with AHSA1/START domain
MIEIEVTIESSISKVWNSFFTAENICKWNFASEEWYCPAAKLDFKEGGEFCYTMSAKDQSFCFDLKGVFLKIVPMQKVEYTLEDGRMVKVEFIYLNESQVRTIQSFEPESENPKELQKQGWQAILNNFKLFVEQN